MTHDSRRNCAVCFVSNAFASALDVGDVTLAFSMSTYIWSSFTPSGPLYSATHLPDPSGVSRMSVLPDWSSRIQNFSATPLP